jgi:hypothetical protein
MICVGGMTTLIVIGVTGLGWGEVSGMVGGGLGGSDGESGGGRYIVRRGVAEDGVEKGRVFAIWGC